MNYIAYGSNMNQEQMARRCPGAQLIGTGLLYGYQLEFNRHATIVESSNPLSVVPVAVWEITPDHERQLDRYEGFPIYYIKIACTVNMENGQSLRGMAYQMSSFAFQPPIDLYYQGILEAYRKLGLNSQIKRALLPALMRSHRFYRG